MSGVSAGMCIFRKATALSHVRRASVPTMSLIDVRWTTHEYNIHMAEHVYMTLKKSEDITDMIVKCYLIGAAKSGTMWLAYWMGQYRDIYIPAVKETNFH